MVVRERTGLPNKEDEDEHALKIRTQLSAFSLIGWSVLFSE